MDIKENIQKIDQLKSSDWRHGKLSAEVLKKINYKFRLDWIIILTIWRATH